MPKAIWKNQTIAESQKTVLLEGNYYFPPESVRMNLLEKSQTETVCPWKGKARYFHLEINGETNEDAAWTYPQPKEAASKIRDHLAFWRGVHVEES